MINTKPISFGIFGPAAPVVDNAIAALDGPTGRKIQARAVTIDDDGNIIMPEDSTIGLTDALITFDGSNKDIVLDAGADGMLTVGKTGYSAIEGVLIEKAALNMLQLDFTDNTSSAFLQFTESGTAICQFGGRGTSHATEAGWFDLKSQVSAKGINIYTTNTVSGGELITARFTADAGTQRGLNIGHGIAGAGPPTTVPTHGGVEALLGVYSDDHSAVLVDTAAAKSGGYIFASAATPKWFILRVANSERLAFYNATPAEVFTMDQKGNFLIGNNTAGASMAGGMAIALGTDPTGDVANQFALFGKDQAIGNTAPAVRTENGAVIHLFQALKADYNNWAALGDVVNALVAIGLFDQA